MKRPQFDRIQLLLEQRRHAQARSELEALLLERPEDPLLHALLVHALLENNSPSALAAAERHAHQALRSAPEAPFCHYTLALVRQSQQQYGAAAEALQVALAQDPQAADYHARLGLVQFLRQRLPEALRCAEAALQLEPEHTDAANLRNMILLQQGQTDKASAGLQPLLQREPDNARLHSSRGWILLDQGQWQAARQPFEEALRLDPELNWAREGLIESLKSRWLLYRLVRRYQRWLGRFRPAGQWGRVLLIVLLLQLSTRLAGQAGAEQLMLGLVLLYLGFVLLTWLADPLCLLALRLHPQEQRLLSAAERQRSSLTAGLLMLSLGFALLGFWQNAFWLGAIFCLALLIPLNLALEQSRSSPQHYPALLYSGLLGSLALGSLLSGLSGFTQLCGLLALAFGLGWAAFLWLSGLWLLKSRA
ncbi:MAG: tetratricopeptide repeat protein [Candidatus Sericytochromatia bacterium]|nr:tetratricopeptide repeat protein [Candidatus Sericytochromatia bacterium]